MRDDVVERLGAADERGEVALDEIDVAQAELLRAAAGQGDRLRRDVAADELRLRQAPRHRQQVRAVAAADLEHASFGDIGRRKPEQRGDRGEMGRMRLRVRLRGVGDRVVLLRELAVGVAPGFLWCHAPILVERAATVRQPRLKSCPGRVL